MPGRFSFFTPQKGPRFGRRGNQVRLRVRVPFCALHAGLSICPARHDDGGGTGGIILGPWLEHTWASGHLTGR